VVAAEIAILPLALHLPIAALVFTLLNAVVLFIRIRAESRVLGEAASWPGPATS
jgi:methyltransferase